MDIRGAWGEVLEKVMASAVALFFARELFMKKALYVNE